MPLIGEEQTADIQVILRLGKPPALLSLYPTGKTAGQGPALTP